MDHELKVIRFHVERLMRNSIRPGDEAFTEVEIAFDGLSERLARMEQDLADLMENRPQPAVTAMELIKIGNRYINMALVEHAEFQQPTLYLYQSNYTVRVVEPDEVRAVLAWLDYNSANVMRPRDL